MSKMLIYLLAFGGGFILSIFGASLYSTGFNFNTAASLTSQMITSTASFVTEKLSAAAGTFTSLFQENPQAAVSYVLAGAAPVATVGYTAYKWIRDRKNRELNSLLEQRMMERSETLNFEADLKNTINNQEQQIKNLQAQLAGNLDVSEVQQRLTAAQDEVAKYRSQIENLHAVIRNMKIEQVIVKEVVK